jgi:hypothetical protein
LTDLFTFHPPGDGRAKLLYPRDPVPIALGLSSFLTDPTTFNEQLGHICLVVGRSGIGGAAALTYFAGARWAERMCMPVGGLVILVYSLKLFFCDSAETDGRKVSLWHEV